MTNSSELTAPCDVNIAVHVLQLLSALDRYIIASSCAETSAVERNHYCNKINYLVNLIRNQNTSLNFVPMAVELNKGLRGELANIFNTVMGKKLINVNFNPGRLYFFDTKNRQTFFYKTPLPKHKAVFVSKISGKICAYNTSFSYLSLLDKNYHYCHHFGKGVFCIYDDDTDGNKIFTKYLRFSRGIFFLGTDTGEIKNTPYTPECLQALIEHKMI